MGEQQGQEPGRAGEAEKPEVKAQLVFGDPLDRQSSDDTDSGWGGGDSGSGRGLDWYVSQRPPHHGG